MFEFEDIECCSKCNSTNTFVINSRKNNTPYRTRRHECQDCGYRWSTVQISQKDFAKLQTELNKTSVDDELIAVNDILKELVVKLTAEQVKLTTKIKYLKEKEKEV